MYIEGGILYIPGIAAACPGKPGIPPYPEGPIPIIIERSGSRINVWYKFIASTKSLLNCVNWACFRSTLSSSVSINGPI